MKYRTERKRTLTLNLSDAEMEALAILADRQGMSKSAVLRQAIRMFQLELNEERSKKDSEECAP